MHKRTFSDFNQEEDDWEKEAFVSSSQRPVVQPNHFATYIDTLDKQYYVLSDTSKDLEEQLNKLQINLHQFEKEEDELQLTQEQYKQEYLNSIDKTLLLLQQHDLNNTDSEYLKVDEMISSELKGILDNWKEKQDINDNTDQKIKSLAHQYRYTEFDIIDLTARIEGFKSRIKILERDISKINSLPQIIPVLRADMEKYKSEMHDTTQSLEKLENQLIRPYLIELSELKISNPLQQDQIENTFERMNNFLNDLNIVTDIAIKQRANQATIDFIYQSRTFKEQSKSALLDLFTQSLEEQANSLVLENEKTVKVDDNENTYLKIMKKLLDDFFEFKKDIVSTKNITLADQINQLKNYEATLKEKWEQDIQSCLDAIAELETLKSKLFETLYGQSHNKDNLMMTPESYVNLQNELESRTNELKTRIYALEKDINDPHEKATFEKHRKLFSLYYTDPDEFLDLVTK